MRNRTINLIGWILFLLSAIGFVLSSIRNGDQLGLVASLFFLVACIVFMIPFARRSPGRTSEE